MPKKSTEEMTYKLGVEYMKEIEYIDETFKRYYSDPEILFAELNSVHRTYKFYSKLSTITHIAARNLRRMDFDNKRDDLSYEYLRPSDRLQLMVNKIQFTINISNSLNILMWKSFLLSERLQSKEW